MIYLKNLLEITLEALPFLAFGCFLSGLLKTFVSNDLILKHLGREKWYTPIKAAFLGMPIPLCSCSVIPMTTGLRKAGAERGSMTSFLISAPETGLDSLAISYTMLGPIMTLVRLLSALLVAIFTAWLVMFGVRTPLAPMKAPNKKSVPKKSCCTASSKTPTKKIFQKILDGQRYAFTTLLDDSFKWIAVALLITALIKTYLPINLLSYYGDSFLLILLMVLIGFPMYICASASTPVAVGFLAMGVSPGAALAFMLAGPASNIATIGVVSRLMGKKSSVIYLLSVCLLSALMGVFFNKMIHFWALDIQFHQGDHAMIPASLAIALSCWVVICAIKPLRPFIGLLKQ